jgi:putative nucleotidyltransferase with HDIG domain
LAVSALAPFATSAVGSLGPADQVVLALLLVASLASELVAVAIPGAGDLSIGLPIGVAATIFIGPLYAGLMNLVSMVPYLIRGGSAGIFRRLINTASVVLTAVVPGLLYLLVGGQVLRLPIAQASPVALLLAGISGPLVNLGIGAVGHSLVTKRRLAEAWQDGLAWMLLPQVALSFVGVAIAQVLRNTWLPGLALFIVPLLVARQTYQRSVQLRAAYADTIASLVAALEAKDVYTKGHSVRVARYSVAIAHGLGLPQRAVDRLEWAALLHDIGKVGVKRRVLAKASKLSDDEFDEIRQHPAIGARILAEVPYLADLVPAIEGHHEKLDGTGYGKGIRGDQIPLEARVLSVADAFDAMTSTRPYRQAMSPDAALAELGRCTGTQFDDRVVEAFLRSIDENPALLDEVSPG